jgi:hypothetical protein
LLATSYALILDWLIRNEHDEQSSEAGLNDS